ncbi:structure-specific endonuclease subunit SLX4 [Crotalus adamanteus]|uniref:Structure-specific endonuclease subunit SLX4 n=1 Tax=Crotalus adamanteus TaxID=8729 RepID=A0AAW1AU18_CROAD
MGRPGAVEGCATVSIKCNKNGRRFCCFAPPSVPVRGCGSEGRQAVGGARAATGRRSLRSCADKMDDSEDEFRSRVPPGRRRRPRGIGTAAALAAGPPPLPPGRGLKRDGAPSAARPAGGKRRRAAGGETLEAAARSRAEVGLGGKRPKAETRGCGRPPPLLLQRPEEARRGLEARAALLLSEAPAAPHTPPLPASRWDGGPAASSAGWLWELSSLTAVTPRGADQRPEFRAPGAPAESPETERFSSRAGDCFEGGRPRDADTLQDLVELAGEGLTFTQWSLDIGRPEPPEQEQMPGVQQKAFTRLLEKQQQQQQLFQNCSYEKFPLGSLAVAFKEMVNNPHLSDIQIQVDSGEVFYAHMFVLYARCPQLLQFVDHRCFVVAEEGEVRASRVLLHDAPGDAVALFLKYLYTAEHFVPQHLLSDVVDLAIRFGVKELAVLCEGQSSEEISVEKPVDDKDKVGNFEELLKSMWQDEETAAKSVCRDEINDSMNEQELEEIYEFVATQRRMTSDEDNHPVNVASSVANSAATFHFGVGDLLLHNPQNWPGKDSDSNEALPACSSLSASIPVSKISDLACQARDISCVSPFMPLPPYSSMDTPELKKELSRFGVRALPKQQMVLKLKEIFQFTHQQARTDSKKKSMPVATSSFQKLEQKCLAPYRLLQGNPNTTNLTDLSEGGAQRPEAGLGWPKRAAFPAKRLADGESNGDLILTTSQVSAGTTGTGNETYAAFQSSSVEFKISMLSEKEENVPASQIAASEARREKQQHLHRSKRKGQR